jgi:hypothetical protein
MLVVEKKNTPQLKSEQEDQEEEEEVELTSEK